MCITSRYLDYKNVDNYNYSNSVRGLQWEGIRVFALFPFNLLITKDGKEKEIG